MKFNTKLVNFDSKDANGSTNTPVYLSNSFAYEKPEDLEAVFNNKAPGYTYTRVGNPSISNVEQKLATLEQGETALLCSSGMGAITTCTLAILEEGDEFIATSSLFGGTYNLFKSYKNYGIKPRFASGVEKNDIAELLNNKTKFVFLETLGNPKLDIPDIKGIAELCKEKGVPLIVDNTMTSPCLINPIELGANIVIHSTSKYINGTANSIGGVIIDGANFNWGKFNTFSKYKEFSNFAFSAKIRGETARNLGACISPMNSFLNELGIPTLALRIERHCQNAFELAQFLDSNPEIDEVTYPGLKENKYHTRAKDLFQVGFGGMLTLRVGSKEKAFKIIESLQYFYNSPNIGDVKSLVIHPASTIYANNTAEEKEVLGVYDDLIRISVGVEDIEDLKGDFTRALEDVKD
ncbi:MULTISPECIES: O-acetylhomoserine aminocarboxypropyltransferase/cysteine synthase family protein [unclassified Candidatus Frackibacter]|uniref:O-acetylhomoserine aminocarboxypropyltransferase/cysteine synthase family protein n=1 Tax=unclassified Candidatus Frackibacter TaxID=2648818 RepID=UPI000884BD12|nr:MULTISPECIES: aminotransferase class I/II-fold pyridoxal phosphate-dependent enzyme [unclassified Candidatus Frackibacter]SDC24347.1 O-acetylhomoserine (thiol)-lyase [Candidatus Frackibacter sp. WG11]SEM47665.1 O-acetylhomoserine (thiol)-lyase [Candidatus Frackibacter sp. WG12]SFL49736.1 O-acetylhomoserine (thiol)-lyase [Candidatus Frackibacter sp. WG13]